MRFVHISDTHIGSTPAFSNYGHSPLANLEILVETINNLTFEVDFVLHTGDVVEDGSRAAYELAQPVLARLKLPIYYVPGNHDNTDQLCPILLGKAPTPGRMDYQFEIGGVQFAVFDTRALGLVTDPTGIMTDAQFAALRALCTPDGPPLAIAIHHPPVVLDSAWIDDGILFNGRQYSPMLLENGAAFMEVIAPARARLAGVFLGHVHRSYEVLHNGILFSSAASSFGQLQTWPDVRAPLPAPHEPGAFNVVTITPGQTIVRQHALPRPR